MMGARVTITIDGIDEVVQNLTNIGERSEENLVKLTAELARDTEDAWKAAWPVLVQEAPSGEWEVKPPEVYLRNSAG